MTVVNEFNYKTNLIQDYVFKDTYRKEIPQPQTIENEDEFVTNSGRRLKNDNNNNNKVLVNEKKTAISGVSVLSSDDIQLLNAEDLSDSLQAELHLSLERLSDSYEADDIKRLEETKRKNTELKQQLALNTEKSKGTFGITDLFNVPEKNLKTAKNGEKETFQNVNEALHQNSMAQHISTALNKPSADRDSSEEDDSLAGSTADSLDSMKTPKNIENKTPPSAQIAQLKHGEALVDKYASLRYNPEYVKSLKKENRPSSIPRPAGINFGQAPRLPESPVQQDLDDSLDSGDQIIDRKEGAIIMHTRMPSSLTSVSMTRLSHDPDQLLKMNQTYEEEFALMLQNERNRGKKIQSEKVFLANTKKIIDQIGEKYSEQHEQCPGSPQISSFWSTFEDFESPKVSKSSEVVHEVKKDVTKIVESKSDIVICESTTNYLSPLNIVTQDNSVLKKEGSNESLIPKKECERIEDKNHTMEMAQPQSFGNSQNSDFNEKRNMYSPEDSTPRLGGYVPLPARHMLTPSTDQRPVAISPRHQQPTSSPRHKNLLHALEPEVTPPHGRKRRGHVPTPPKQPRGNSKDFVELNKQRLGRKTNSASYLELFSKRKTKNTPDTDRPQSDLTGNVKEKENTATMMSEQRQRENSVESSNYPDEFDGSVTTEDMWSKQAARLKQMRQPAPKRTSGFRQLGTREHNTLESKINPASILDTYQPSVYMTNQQLDEDLIPQQRIRHNRRQMFNESGIHDENGFHENVDQESSYHPSFGQDETPAYRSIHMSQMTNNPHVALPPDQSAQQFTPRRRVTFNRFGAGMPQEMLHDVSSLTPLGNGLKMLERNQMKRYAIGKENKEIMQDELSYRENNTLPPLYKPSKKNEDRESLSPRKINESENGYASLYNKQKRKPWYKVYTLNDYKNLKRDVKLGGLGPDLEAVKPKVDQIERAKKYSEFIRQQHRSNKIVSDQPLSYYEPGHHFSAVFDENIRQEQIEKRQKAMEYAKRIPKPKLKPPTSNQQTPPVQSSPAAKENNLMNSGGNVKNISPLSHRSQDGVVDNYDIIQAMRERHEREKAQVSNFRQYA